MKTNLEHQDEYLSKRIGGIDLEGVFTLEDFNSDNVAKLGEKFRDLVIDDYVEDMSVIYPDGVEWEDKIDFKKSLAAALNPAA